MQQLRQHTFGCGHCALCVAAKSVFALFAGFLTLALTFASTLILSSVLFTSTAFAQVNAENSGSAASAQTAATTQNASNKTAGQSDSAATANAGNTSEKANAALATNSASTSKNAGSAAASGASSTAQNAANNGAANAGQEAANNSNSQANPKTFSITYIVDGKSATTDGVAGTIKLATLESKTVNGVSYTFLGWKLEDGTLLKGGTDFEMTKDVTLTAEWKVESANGSTSIDTITDQDSSNSAINGENPGQGDLPETDNGNKGPDAPDYVVLPNEGESNSQVNDGNSSSNSQVTNTTPPQNQGGTATSPGNSGTTLPNSSGSSVSSSNNSNSSSAKDLTASPNAPPVNAPKNSSSSAASESNKANLAAQATPTENPFSATLKNVFWSWDPVSGTLTIGNIGTNTATINIGAFTASTLPWLTAADGAAPQAIKHIVTKQNAYGGGITCDSFESWFENYTALISFNGMGLVVTNSTSFARMFKGCVSLTSITGISGWHAEQATDYSEMFAGCSSLESIDLSVFVTADKPASGSGTVTRNRTNMLAGMTSLKQIRLGTMTSLVDTGLDAISSRTDKLGVWDAEDKVADEDARWSGTSSQLIARYPVTGGVSINNALITDIIDYIFHPKGTFDSNNKVNWDFNTTTSTLTIFASDSALPNETLVTEAVMPWLDAIDKNSVKYVSFLTQNTGGQNLSKVLFSTLAGVFEGYVNLITFDGSGLNTTRVNDFSNLFKGDTALTTISLSGWSMRDQRDAGNLQISGMFEGCNALSTLTLGKDVVLFVSATNHAGVDGLYGRGDNDGVWERTDSKTNDPWFGTSANLEKRYSSGTPYVDRGDAVYTFTTAYRGGRFENDNTWWKYTVGANQKTLTIGADLLEPGETGDYRIARIERADLPWLKLVNGQPIVDVTQITYITTVGSTVGNMVGQAAPEFMAHWFEGFTSLINFNGSNLNTQYCTDFTDLFKGDTKLISINVAGWDTSASSIATRAGMFDGCDALLTLTVGPKVELTGTGLEALANHTTDDGTWVRQDSTTDSWMGSSENLVNRYNGPTSEGAGLPDEPAIYYFDDSILRNVFQSNANVWWQFDKDEKTLTIGVNMAGGNIAVDETYDLVPWLAVLGKGTADPAATARAMIEHIDFKQLVQVLNPAMWFKDYVNLADAYVANLGISQATSIASIFQGCGKLKILNGLGSWDPSNVTNMSHAFDGANFTDPGALENWNNKVGKVTDLSYIFANNGNVTTLECIKDWILSSATNFAYAFANCSRLVSLDISGWDMGKATTAASRENMLYGLDRLNTLVLSNTSNLNNTGLGLTDSTVTRGDTNGTWEANRVTNTLVGTAENAWFGTSEDLMRRYDPTRYPMGFNLGDDITYTWKPGVYGGRMPDAEPGNPYEDLWWKFVKGTDDATGRNTGTLTIGTDAAGGTNLTLTPDTAPWVDLIWRIFGDADAKAGLSHVTHFVAQAGKALTANLLLSADSLTGLFAANLGYTGLTRFTGTGFDVSNVTSLAHLFDGTSTLVQVLGIDGWKTGNVTDLSYMFAGNSKLTTITSLAPDGTKGTWDVHNVRNFSHMFEGCSALTELTAFNNWAVSAGSNFAYMFSGCTNLTTLDIWAWDMSNATSLDHMLADLESITTLGVGSKTALTGAAFEDIATRQKKNGSWDRQGSTWFGNTQNIVLLYPANVSGLGNALGDKIYYTWAEGILRGRFESNDNAYWSVTWNGTPWTATGILTIGIDNPAGNRVVTETWEQTPWTEALSTEGTRDGNNLITFITMERGITPTNFAFWFANYANLTDFNGRADNDELGLDVSQTTSLEGLFQNDRKLSIVGNIYDWDVDQVTNFDSLFENCSSLYTIDIHKWIMGPNATTSHVNMLKGLTSLRTLILNGNISLKDSGLDDATSDPTHAETQGSWLRIKDGTASPYNTDPWFGSSASLIGRYYENTNIHGSGDGEGAIYTWTDQLRGRFDDNDNTWWSWDANRKILTMGVDAAELNETIDPATGYRVTATAGALPWERAIPTIKKAALEIYAVLNGTLKICPTSMEGWFQGYTALTSFDGTNFDTSLLTSNTASLDNLFNGCTALRTLNLTNWNWQATGVSHVDMFKDLNSITKITLETGAALDGTGFDTISTRQNTQGRWVMETELTGAGAADIPWFDSSQKLVYRYPGYSAGAVVAKVNGVWTVLNLLAGTHTYTWNTPILGGRFEDNPNAWWMFYKVSGWDFSWTITSTDPDFVTRTGVANGATFTMPDGAVSITGVWKRALHEVQFVAGADPHGTVSVKAPATLPFYVEHGKKMTEPGSTGHYGLIEFTEDTGWALAGWRYLDPTDGQTKDTTDPNSVVINANTVFTAIWAQTFYVAYDPGSGPNNHGGTGFTTLQRGGTDIGLGVNVKTLPLIIGGADRTKDAPAADGYKFIGWTWKNGGDFYWITDAATAAGYDTTGLGTAAQMDFTVERNITFTAIWEAIEQTLTYKIDGDNSPASNWTNMGKPGQAGLTTEDYVVNPKPRTDEVVTLLTGGDVERTGYTLAGWQYTDKDGITHTINGSFTMPAYAVTLTPVWDFAGLKIYFDYANGCDNTYGGLDKFSVNIDAGNASAMHIDGATASAYTGYKFMGWYEDADHTIKVDGYAVDGNHFIGDGTNGWTPKTYYAWFDVSETTYVIEFNLQTTTGFNTFERTFTGVTTGSTVDVEAAGNKAYADRLSVEAESAFASYVFDPTHANSELVKVVMADGTTKLILFYNMLPFDITYDKDLPDAAYTWDWVSEAGPNKGTAEKTITIPSAKRDGYQFAGWTITYVDPVSGDTVTTDLAGNTFIMPMAPVLVTAKWAQYMDVVIEYFKRGDVDPLGTETDRAIEGTTYTVSLDQIAAFKAAHMSELNGYRYIDDGKRSVVITSDPRHNVIQIFFDLINDFGVQFDKNYGDNRIIGKVEGMSLADMPYGSRPSDPKRAGWVLDADKTWNTKADGTGLQLKLTTTLDELLKAVYGDDYNADDFLKAGGILTLYAIWNQNDQFEVIYDMNNMKEKNPNILNDMPEWREDMAAEDKKGALWDQAGFNFKPIDKELSAPHGYEFVGWNTKADGTGRTITDATKYFEMSNWIDPNVEQMSITLYAMWKEIELDIEYLHTVGGTVDRVLDRISAVTGQHVQTGSSPINPTERLHSVATAEAGYHFVRWELYDENKHAGLLRAMADGDSMTNILRFLRNDDEEIVVDPNEGRYYGARYIAIFEKNADATLVYDINGGTLGEIDSVTISHGLTTKLHNGVYVASTGKGYKRPYYTLVGWSTKPGEDNQVEYRLGQDYVMPEGGLTLYAVWQINSFPVDVDHRDDDLGKVDGGHADVVYGEKLSPEFIQSISQQPKNNSTFKGWHVTMTDSETGEIVFDQWVTDLSTLPDLLGPVVGPVSIAADYEAVPVEDLVTEGTTLPKTGDNGVLGWIIALVAGFALALIVLFARRRQDDDDDDDELRARRASAPAYAEVFANAAAALRESPVRIVGDAQSAAPTMLTLRKRNGRTRNTTHADGIAGTAISPAPSFADSSSDSRNSSFGCVRSDTLLADARPVAFVRGAALSLVTVVLGCAVAFAPGIALATTGDPGTGSTSTASSHIQTNHSNTDPATSQTGSFQSKSTKAASASASSAKSSSAAAKSSANSTSAPSSSASAGFRASKNTSAAPSKATVSGSGSTLAASSASSAGGSSATAASSGAASESYSTRIATSDNIKRLAYLNALANRTSTYRSAAPAAAASSASASTGAITRTVGVSSVSSSSAASSAALVSIESAGDESAGASSAVPGGLPAASDDSLAALGSVLSLKSSTDDSFAHTAAMFALRSTDQTQNDPNPNDGSGSGAATGDAFDVPRFRASATDSDDAVINDPGEPPGKTDDSTIIYPDDPDPQPGDEPGDDKVGDSGTDTPVPDDPAEPADLADPDPAEPTDPADTPTTGDVSDTAVKISYRAGQGGSVSYASDKICSSTGTKLDENGKPTDKELVGPLAAPKVGYHFVGWAIDDPSVDSTDDLVIVTNDASLDARTVKDCAFSDKANCYKAASFIALFKCNDYLFNYDANGGQLSTTGTQIEPTQATFGSNALFSTAASPARDGYKFLCWNTAASGLGAAIREGDALSAEKMRGMVIEAPVEDENGAAIQLYAQWTPVPAEPTPIDPSELERPTQPVKPVVPTTPVSPGANSNTSAGSNAGANTNTGASAGVSQPSRLVNAATADESTSEEALAEAPLLMEDEALAALFAGIGAIGDAVVMPPALEVLPAATEEFVTRSAEAISGVPGVSNGQDDSVGAMQAVGVATAAAGAIALVLGVASAVSSTIARRRVVRALGAETSGGSSIDPGEAAGKAD